MIKNYCFNVIVVVLVATTNILATPIPAEDPQQSPTDKTNSLFNIPFLEFKNGGVRVNFGGYHAEAGLGGLLGDSRANGGLHAGAGTPFGAHASAGLGGDVHGKNGDGTGGGLYARAGLGNGGPESAAGLGGKIDDSNPSENEGRIYAAKSNGGRTRIVLKNIGGDQNSGGIQRIPLSDDTNLSSNIKGLNEDNQNAGMVRREIILPDEKFNAVEPVAVPVTDTSVHVYPTRRCRRRQRCNNVITKTIIHQQQLPLSQIPSGDFGVDKYIPAYGQLNPQLSVNPTSSDKIIAEKTANEGIVVAPGPAPIPPLIYQRPRNPTFFDDIFNIPISALAAVNQLLNNKAG